MKIYMVSKGSYSDWHIVKQFLSKDLAEKFIEAAKDDGWEHLVLDLLKDLELKMAH